MKKFNFLSKSSSQSCGHSSVTLGSTVGSQEEFYVSGGNSRGAFTPADVCQTSSVRLNRFIVHRRSTLLKLISVLVLIFTFGIGQMWGATAKLIWSSGTNSGTNYYFQATSGSISNVVSFSCAKNSASSNPAYNSNNSQLRLYNGINNGYTTNGNSITLTPATDVTITGFSIASATNPITKYKVGTGTATAVSYNNSSPKVATVSNISATSSAALTIQDCNTSNSQLQIKYIEITYTVASSCENKVTISAGTNTNCTFTLTPNGQQESCDGVATTVSITPTPGYGNPSVTQSGASKTPTISGTGNTRTITYQANTTGTSNVTVSCSANNYTITLNNQSATTAGTASIQATYNASTNLTSAINVPEKTGWTFGGYFTQVGGGGTQIIDASGNVLASKTGYTDSNKKWIKADNVTLYAKWTRTVTWSVNGLTNISASTVTYNATASKVASIPTAPNPASYCGDKFVGWTTDAEYVHGTSPLFTTAADSPDLNSITTDIIFYAVFADYAQQ